jgi:uracil-DNA glycosylase
VKEVHIEKTWKEALSAEFGKDYFKQLSEFVRAEYTSQTIYPKPASVFAAFNETPFEKVRVVILGQDPYHGPNQAHGLSFSVQAGVDVPPSLRNIFKEIESDTGKKTTIVGGDLTPWARHGVLLLNATLTVRAGLAGSHQGKGWEEFTDAAIQALNDQREHIVFILWGRYAREKGKHIDRFRHLVIESAHPSPLSAHNGFFGSKPFSKTNAYLSENGLIGIAW